MGSRANPKTENRTSADLRVEAVNCKPVPDAEDRPLERSACVGCPFQSRQRWVETKRRWPELFAEAVAIDSRLRAGLPYAKEPYLHSMRIPLDQAVALDEVKLGSEGRVDGFGNECEGHCGV